MGLRISAGSIGGKATASDVALTLGSSKQLVELTTLLASGKHITHAEVEAYRPFGGDKQLVDEFHFDDVLISSLGTGNATSNALSFDFTKYSHGHELFDQKTGQEVGFVS